MPHAPRHARALKKNPPKSPAAEEYIIQDPHHKPDLRGEFAGQKPYQRGIVWYVQLTPSQAKFYLASGSVKREGPPKNVTHAVKDRSTVRR
jgi:hypothetical protein